MAHQHHSHHDMGSMASEGKHSHDPSSYDHIEHMHADPSMFNGTDDLAISYGKDMGVDVRSGGHEGHGEHHGGHHVGHHMMHDMGDMSMTFHGGYNETILFSWWKVTDAGEFTGSFFAIFIMALFYEGLKYYRKHLLWKTYHGLQYCAVAPPDKGVSNVCATDEPGVIQRGPHVLERNVPTMLSRAHAWQTALHGLQVLVSYVLMLVFMTYNVWLCAAVVFGSATGYFLFGWRESVVVDFTEHCH